MQLKKISIALLCSASAFALADQAAPVVEMGSSSMSIGERVTQLEQMLLTRGKAQINIQQQIDDLQQEMNELRGVTETHGYKLEQILNRQRELYQEIDKRLSNASVASPQVNAPELATETTTSVSEPTINYSNNLSENEAYERAVNMVLKDKRYDAAIPEFRAFNAKYPNSTYAANSHYWLGQLLFFKNDFVESEKEFLVVVEQYQDTPKRPDAMLKLGMVAQKLSQNDKAKKIYDQLIAEYPESSAAKLATSRLSSL